MGERVPRPRRGPARIRVGSTVHESTRKMEILKERIERGQKEGPSYLTEEKEADHLTKSSLSARITRGSRSTLEATRILFPVETIFFLKCTVN